MDKRDPFPATPVAVRSMVIVLYDNKQLTTCEAIAQLFNLGFRGRWLDLAWRPN